MVRNLWEKILKLIGLLLLGLLGRGGGEGGSKGKRKKQILYFFVKNENHKKRRKNIFFFLLRFKKWMVRNLWEKILKLIGLLFLGLLGRGGGGE